MNRDQWKKKRAGEPAVYAGRQGNADVLQAYDQKIDRSGIESQVVMRKNGTQGRAGSSREDTSNASDDASNHLSGMPHSQHILSRSKTPSYNVIGVTFPKDSRRHHMSFSESELGYNDYVSIDASEYQPCSINGSELVIQESREVLLEFINEVIASSQSDEELAELQQHYQVVCKECRSINLMQRNLEDIRHNLLVLIVHERLLFGKSIKLVAACSGPLHEDIAANLLGMDCAARGGYEIGDAIVRGSESPQRSRRDYMHFSEEELGRRVTISIDVSEYVISRSSEEEEEEQGKRLVVEEDRQALLGFIHDVIAMCQNDQELNKLQLKCIKLREACYRVNLTHWVPAHMQHSLLGLAVYERLLYGKPIKLVAKSLEEQLGLRYAGKGGYEVTGEFVKGGGRRTVYLSSDEFPRDAHLFLDMSDEYGCYPFPVSAGQLVHAIHTVAQSTKEWKSTKGEQLIQLLRYECKYYSNNPIAALLDRAADNKRWNQHQCNCLDLAALESGMYGKPIPLLSPSASEVFASREKHAAYVKLIREAINRISL